MKLKSLYIDGFGKFHNKSIEFGDGINLIYGKNEAGKSTLHTFIKAMLFGLSESPKGRESSEYEKYEPWTGETYGGSMELYTSDGLLRIERDFKKGPRDLKLFTIREGQKIPMQGAEAANFPEGLTENAYKNTISIGQLKARTEKGMAREFKDTVKNLNTTGSSELSYDRAIEYLEKKEKAIDESIDEDAAINYSRRMGRIRNLERELSEPKYENRIPVYTELRDKMKDRLSELTKRREELVLKTERAEDILKQNGFTDEASIDECEKKAEGAFSEYRACERALKKKAAKAAAFIFAVIGIASCTLGAYLMFLSLTSPEGFYTPVYAVGRSFPAGINGIIFCAAGLLSLIIFLMIFMGRRKRRRRYDLAASSLAKILAAHTGNGDINEEAMSSLRERLQEFRKLIKALRESEEELSSVKDELIKLHENHDSCLEIIGKEEKVRAELEDKLTELNNLKCEAEELKRTIDKNNTLRENRDAIELAKENLGALSQRIRNSVGIYLNREAGKLIKSITGGAYDSMDVSDDMEIFLNAGGRMITPERVSAGTMDQIYLALRLSAVRLLERQGRTYPLIFDDSFALYDDERLELSLKAVRDMEKEGEKRRQIIIFTCHRREESILKREEADFKIINM